MLAVHRKDLYVVFFCQRHNDMTGSYKCLFVCKCNILSCFYCCNGRAYPDHANDRCHQHFCFFHLCDLKKSLHAGNDLHRKVCGTDPQLLCFFFVPDSCDLRMKLADLALQLCNIITCCQCFYAEPFRIGTHHIQRLRSDRSG